MSADGPGRFTLAPGVVFQELPDGEGVLLAARTETYYALSRSGSVIVRAVRAGDLDAAVEALQGRFDVDERTARQDVTALVEELVDEGLLTRVS
jgi:hypothetical protein